MRVTGTSILREPGGGDSRIIGSNRAGVGGRRVHSRIILV